MNVPKSAPRLDVIRPLGRAYARTRLMMFSPVVWRFWAAIGLMAFLDNVAQGPVGFSYALRQNPRQFAMEWFPFSEDGREVAQVLLEQSGLLIVIGLPSVLLIFLASILLLWLGSRGQVMFIRAVARNRFHLPALWRETTESAQSLFMFRLTLASITFVGLIVLVLVSSLFVGTGETERWDPAAFNLVFLVGTVGTVTAVIINAILRNLVAPLMVHLNLPCLDAFKLVARIAWSNPGPFLLFFLIHLIWIGVTWVVWAVLGVGTCLIGLIPMVHHALAAPLYVFDRLYSLYVLESLWPQHRLVSNDVPPGTAK